jgi:phosphoribosylanthranilate isomerase
MVTKVKICGITNLDDALCAAEAGADALGFIFYPKSPRYVTVERVAEVVGRLPPFITPVGVFVNETQAMIEEVIGETRLRAVQLHGDEPPGDYRNWRVPVLKAFRVEECFDVGRLHDYRVDAYLLDTYREGVYGGTGDTFDWGVAVRAKVYGPIILSGGLTPENVEQAVAEVHPYAVDVGSGVECAPGRKDHQKVRMFVRQTKGVT